MGFYTNDNYQGSLGKSTGQHTYIKQLDSGSTLSVHAPNGIVTGAKLNGTPISNTQAALFDSLPGTIKKDRW
ncbi:MAG: hypothetical protein ABJG41_14905 [Cyclobacteriaceae bacterium]